VSFPDVYFVISLILLFFTHSFNFAVFRVFVNALDCSTPINMAKISRPSSNRKGTPPPEFEPSVNLNRSSDVDLKPMNFKVKAEFKREFKTFATSLDMSMVQLLQECFEHYKHSR